jgi:hypothetical protein
MAAMFWGNSGVSATDFKQKCKTINADAYLTPDHL